MTLKEAAATPEGANEMTDKIVTVGAKIGGFAKHECAHCHKVLDVRFMHFLPEGRGAVCSNKAACRKRRGLR